MEDLPFREPDIWVLKESISHELVSKHLNLYITTGYCKNNSPKEMCSNLHEIRIVTMLCDLRILANLLHISYSWLYFATPR